jgi:lipid-binding SYLF domain-containing protein
MVRKYIGMVTALLMVTFGGNAFAEDDSEVIERFRKAGAGELIDAAYGYAIFPTIGKGGIGIGGAHGSGRVYKGKNKLMGETKMTQITYGLQLGGQAFSQLILFEDERSFDEFTDGNFEFGAQATAVALTAGAGAEASTTGAGTNASGGEDNANVGTSGFRKGMATFTITKGGLMYEATLGGQKFSYKPNK